jgi:hypothetical protein
LVGIEEDVPQEIINFLVTEKDSNAYEHVLRKYGNKAIDGAYFKVLLGVYTDPVEETKYADLEDVNIEREISRDGILHRYIAGNYNILKNAHQFRESLRKEGYTSTWIVPYYQGERISFKELQSMLDNHH